jgi:hypothetical protein
MGMREYGKIGPKFWIGETGKKLKAAGPIAQVTAMYLLTSPHANMLGLFYQPVLYLAHETGLGMEGASEGLRSCIEAGFCDYDPATEMVWVYEMAKYQVGESLTAADKRSVGVQNEYNALPVNPFLSGFYDRYGAVFHMSKKRVSDVPSSSKTEGATKALPSPLEASSSYSSSNSNKDEANASVDSAAEATGADLLGNVHRIGKVTPPSGESDQHALPACPFNEIVAAYHELMPENPRVKTLSEARKRTISARWREAARLTCQPFGYTTRADGIASWRKFFEVCARSDFLTGKGEPRPNMPPFFADIDFLTSPSGFTNCLENKYHREVAA